MGTRLSALSNRMRVLGLGILSGLDPHSLAGAGLALLVLLLCYVLFVLPEGDSVSMAASVAALLAAVSPLIVAYQIERTAGIKIFVDFQDFCVAVAWVPLTVIALLVTESKAIVMTVVVCGFILDPLLLGSRRRAYSAGTRIMLGYSRGLCGIIGMFLVLTFVGKLMDVGNPRNRKSLAQEILGVILWGYIGKKFFDFVGVTKPLGSSPLARGSWSP